MSIGNKRDEVVYQGATSLTLWPFLVDRKQPIGSTRLTHWTAICDAMRVKSFSMQLVAEDIVSTLKSIPRDNAVPYTDEVRQKVVSLMKKLGRRA